jgi:hypothetical protein
LSDSLLDKPPKTCPEEPIDGTPMGKSPKISSLINPLFNGRREIVKWILDRECTTGPCDECFHHLFVFLGV